jgi:flagellar basal-body rod protein FlgF
VNSGLYTAYSGLRSQSEALDILSNNLANVNTTGFKEEKAFFTLLDQSLNDPGKPETISNAVNPSVRTQKALNPEGGSLNFTSRDLDIAIEGPGFLVVNTPQGVRYTRNGNLHLNAQSVLTTSDNFPVLGDSGQAITLGSGRVQINQDGEVLLDNSSVDRLKIVTFDNISTLEKEGSSLFRSRSGQASETGSAATIRSGYLETSNVNPVSSMVHMVEIMRHFEAIQKSVSLLMNDINSKAIEKLGR